MYYQNLDASSKSVKNESTPLLRTRAHRRLYYGEVVEVDSTTIPEHPTRHCFGINSSDSSANPDQSTTAAKRTFRESICHLGVLVACQSLLSFSPRTICQIPTSLNAHSTMPMVKISRELMEVASMPTLWNKSNHSFSMP